MKMTILAAALLMSSTAAIADPAPASLIGLPPADTLTGAEYVPIYQDGQRRIATVAQLLAGLSAPAVPAALPGQLDFTNPANSALAL